MGDDGDAYQSPMFARYYDAMVASLPPEFEVNVDTQWFVSLVRSAKPMGGAHVLDLACGSGRVLTQLMASGLCDVVVGVDNSSAMLDACRRAISNTPSLACCSTRMSLQNQGMEELEMVDGTQFDLVVISAGSFHHLTTRGAQLSALRRIATVLAPGGQLALTFLADSDVVGESEVGAPAIELAGMRRTQTARHVTAVQEPIDGDEPLFDASVCTSRFDLVGDGVREQHGWSLRTVSSRIEAVALCAASGLTPIAQYASFADALAGRQQARSILEAPKAMLCEASTP